MSITRFGIFTSIQQHFQFFVFFFWKFSSEGTSQVMLFSLIHERLAFQLLVRTLKSCLILHILFSWQGETCHLSPVYMTAEAPSVWFQEWPWLANPYQSPRTCSISVKQICCFLSSLSTLDSSLLLNMWFANIFSQPVACLFTSLTVSFTEKSS